MTWLIPTIIVAILILLLIWIKLLAGRMANKLNALNEYTQFLLFHPRVYADHRAKYLGFIKGISLNDPVNRAMVAQQGLEHIALELYGSIILANVRTRAYPEEAEIE